MDYDQQLQMIEQELSKLDLLEAQVDSDFQKNQQQQNDLEIERKNLMEQLSLTFSSNKKFELLNKIDAIEAQQKQEKRLWLKNKAVIEKKRSMLKEQKYKIEESKYNAQTRVIKDRIDQSLNEKNKILEIDADISEIKTHLARAMKALQKLENKVYSYKQKTNLNYQPINSISEVDAELENLRQQLDNM